MDSEKRPPGKRYKIGMAVRESGVTPQTIRYYEKEKLIFSKREAFGTTRYFGVRQFKQLSNIRRYFKLGFGEDEVRSLLQCGELAELQALIARKKRQSQCEMEALRLRIRMLEEMERRMAAIPALLEQVNIEMNPPLCFLMTRQGEAMIESPGVEAELSRWLEQIHLTSLSTIIPERVFRGEPDSRFRLSGHCIDEELLPCIGGRAREDVLLHIAPRRCLHTVCAMASDNISPRALMPKVYSLIARQGYRVCGDVFGRALAILGEAELEELERPLAAYYEYWIPIEP